MIQVEVVMISQESTTKDVKLFDFEWLSTLTSFVGLAVEQACPTFLLVRATFTGEKLLRATWIFTKIKLQVIARLLYKFGAPKK